MKIKLTVIKALLALTILVLLGASPDGSSASPATTDMSPTFIYLPICLNNACPGPMYADDFSYPGSGWPVADSGKVLTEYSGGKYHILVRQTQWATGAGPGFQASDYSVSVRVKNTSGNFGTYGLAFGISKNWKSLYTLEINPNGSYGIYRYDPGKVVTLIEASSDWIETGTTPNQIKIERNGASISAYANGEFLTQLTDDTYMGSLDLGLIAISYDQPDVDILFDNFTVFRLNCETASPALESQGGLISQPEKSSLLPNILEGGSIPLHK